MNKKSFIFPAFVLKYLGSEIEQIAKSNVDFKERLKRLSVVAEANISDFDINKNNYLNHEYKNQLITYLISVIYADILKSKSIYPTLVSGLSMGLYSALYCAGSINFYDGALLIKRIYEHLFEQTKTKNYKMLAITGLSNDEINEIIEKRYMNCELVIKNNYLSYIIAGEEDAVAEFCKVAREEGAIHLNMFPVSIPYHSKYIFSEELSKDIFRNISIKAAKYKIVSSINQEIVSSIEEIKTEIVKNLTQTVDWHKTIKTHISSGISTFVECGPGNSLKRISKFIDGNHNVVGLDKVTS